MTVLLREREAAPPLGHRVLVVGHRGASAEVAENTLAAVRRAREVGADLVEVDVRATRDGALVLLHDETLARTTDVRRVAPAHAPWRVGEMALADVRRVSAGCGEPVPTLAEAIGEAPLLVDLKEPCVEVLADAVPEGADVTVQSRDVAAVRRLAGLRPDLPVAVLGRPAPVLLPELATWARGVHVHHLRLDRAYVARLHDHGLRCLTWTVNHPRLVERVLGMGVDGVITDRPAALVRRLAAPSPQATGTWWPKGTSSTWPSAASTEGSSAFAVRR